MAQPVDREPAAVAVRRDDEDFGVRVGLGDRLRADHVTAQRFEVCREVGRRTGAGKEGYPRPHRAALGAVTLALMTEPTVAAGDDDFWSVALPAEAEAPFEVFVNGVPQIAGEDYRIDGRWLRFSSCLKPRTRVSLGRRLMLLAGIGVYGDLRSDAVDVHWEGGRSAAHELEILPPQKPLGES